MKVMNMEPTSGTAATGLAIGKALASPGVIGVLAGAVGFLFLWPKDRKEGFSRLVASGITSHFLGDALLRTIVHFAPWIPPEEIRAGAYLLAGLPAWWILGAVIKYLSRGNDIKQIVQDVKGVLKNEQ